MGLRASGGSLAPGPGRERQAGEGVVLGRVVLAELRCPAHLVSPQPSRTSCGEPVQPRRAPICLQEAARPREEGAGSGRGLAPESPWQAWVCPRQPPLRGCSEPCGAPRSGRQRRATVLTCQCHLQGGVVAGTVCLRLAAPGTCRHPCPGPSQEGTAGPCAGS